MELDIDRDELVYLVAAVGRVSEPLNLELYEALYDNLFVTDQHRSEELGKAMKFS